MKSETRFVDNLWSAARANPLSAALIGGGIVWLLAGSERLKDAAAVGLSPVRDLGRSNLRKTASDLKLYAPIPSEAETALKSTSPVGAAIRDSSVAASTAISDVTGKLGEKLEQGVTYAREKIATDKLDGLLPPTKAVNKAKSALAGAFEAQPLLIGGLGLAIGAAVAGSLQRSRAEDRLVGEFSDALKGDLSARAETVSQSIQEGSKNVAVELGDAGAEAMNHLKKVGTDAVRAARAVATQ